MVIAALTALKSTNDDFGMDTPVFDFSRNDCGSGIEPLLMGILSLKKKRTRGEKLTF